MSRRAKSNSLKKRMSRRSNRHSATNAAGKSKNRSPRRGLHSDADYDAAPMFEARIDRLNDRGEGVATICTDNKAEIAEAQITVPYTAAGDLVRLRHIDGHGRLISVLEAGPDRRTPACPLFGDCGGCSFQHLTSNAEDQWKEELVEHALAREGVNCPPNPRAPRLPIAARRRVTVSAERRGDGFVLGFKAKRSHRLVPLTTCLVLAPALFQLTQRLPALLARLPAQWSALTVKVTHCANGFDLDLTNSSAAMSDVMVDEARAVEALARAARDLNILRIAINGETVMVHEDPIVVFDRIPVAMPPGAFLQASVEGQASLIRLVMDALGSVGLKSGDYVADLFSGCGTFTLPMARHYQVYAADNDAPGIAALTQAHRQQQGLKPVKAEVRDLYRQPLMADELARFAAIVMDPPRAGAPAQVKALASSPSSRLVYVSCNPKSFARDARLLASGGFALKNIALVDQFAHSPHVELVGVFAR